MPVMIEYLLNIRSHRLQCFCSLFVGPEVGGSINERLYNCCLLNIAARLRHPIKHYTYLSSFCLAIICYYYVVLLLCCVIIMLCYLASALSTYVT